MSNKLRLFLAILISMLAFPFSVFAQEEYVVPSESILESSLETALESEPSSESALIDDNTADTSAPVVLGEGGTEGGTAPDTTVVEGLQLYEDFYKEYTLYRHDVTQLLQYILIFICVGVGAIIGSCCLRFVKYD